MTLAEAIEINNMILKHQPSLAIKGWQDAIQLDIEALKWRLESEQFDPSLKAFPLPGETEE